jgi:signal transduction histidine kinase/DNA-binding response OmpR family regulator
MTPRHYANPETLRYYRYRQQFHEPDRRQMAIVIIVCTLAICATIRNDFVLLGGTSLLRISLAFRIVHFGATVVLLGSLRAAVRPRQLDWIGATWTILTAVYLASTAILTRLPVGEVQGPIFGVGTAITVFYFAQRGRLCGRLIANAICTIELLILLWHPSSPVSKAAQTTGPVVVLLLNIIGYASARSFEEQRSKRFEAERLERQTRQELATKNRELAIQKENAEAMYRARTAFLAAMSHEFRTPMNAVIGLSDVLANAPVDREYREHARTIRDSASSLLVLLNDVLDFAKIDAGKLELSSAPFDLRALLGSIVNMMRPAASAKKIDLISEFSSDLPEYVIGDDARLRQVLVNLLSNAIKFTSKGAVTFVVTCRVLDKPVYEIGFSVEDTGVGMSPDMMARLFRPFEQGDVGIGRRFGGTGLGLVISKQIVADMRGDIHVESSLGQGSRFSFKLKLQETTAPLTITAPRTRKSESCCSSLAILIVDDVPVNRTVARVMLERLGYEADFANDGQEAIDAATKKDYDVIFMDLQMPGMSGIEATKNIIEKLSGKPMPQVIAMSASVFEEDRAACRAAGMRDFIAKPIDLAKLAMTLERVTEECERSMPTPLKTTSLDPAPLEQLRQLEALDHPGFVANLCQEFLADTPVRIQRMTETLSSGEFNVLEREAHSLKSSSASLGAMELSKLCGTIETSARTKTVDGVEQLLEQLTQELSRVEAELRREGLA